MALSVMSRTWESAEITWTHGFNGGYTQWFVVSYYSESHGTDRHNVPVDATRFNVTGKIYFFIPFYLNGTIIFGTFICYCHIE